MTKNRNPRQKLESTAGKPEEGFPCTPSVEALRAATFFGGVKTPPFQNQESQAVVHPDESGLRMTHKN